MSVIDANEAVRFFKSYRLKVEENLVKEWVKDFNKGENPSDKFDQSLRMIYIDIMIGTM